jgi:hypothetical protein
MILSAWIIYLANHHPLSPPVFRNGFILDESEIQGVGEEMWAAMKVFAKEVGQ